MRASRTVSGPLVCVSIASVVALSSGCPELAPTSCDAEGARANARCAVTEEPGPPRFFAEPPFGVGFDCIAVGCDTKRSLMVQNRGGGQLALSVMRLSVDASADFTLRRADGEEMPTPDAPVLIDAGGELELVIRYRPSDELVDEGQVQLTHYDGTLAREDAVPETDSVRVTARTFGSPEVSLPSEIVDFGYVAFGTTATRELVVDNAGESAVLRVGPGTAEEGTSPLFHPPEDGAWSERFANPGESVHIPVSFTPTGVDAFAGALLLQTSDPGRPAIRVVLQGTAIAEPRLAVLEPIGELVLPPVRVGDQRSGRIVLQNRGGQPLDLGAYVIAGAELGFGVNPGGYLAVPPLGVVQLDVSLTALTGGQNTAVIGLASNDPLVVDGVFIGVRTDVNAPQLFSYPAPVDLGAVVQGWTAPPGYLWLWNGGYGDLTISDIHFELGSSTQVQLVSEPQLPMKLAPFAILELPLMVRAEAVGPANAALIVTSDSVDAPVQRIEVFSNVISCEEGCPTPNGTPQCASGFCEIESCYEGMHDADGFVDNGCECEEDPGGDIGFGCGTGRDMGHYDDCGDAPNGANATGTIHDIDDIDLFYFTTTDTSSFLSCDATSDSSQSSVELLSAPPGLALCANIRARSAGCGGNIAGFDPAMCKVFYDAPVDFHHCGSANVFGDGDNKSVTFWLTWEPDAAPVCGYYEVQVRGKQNDLCD